MIEVVALDGDDTLWHNELQFSMTQQQFCELVAPYAPEADLDQRLLETERRNLRTYGYGVKSFALSMIETAIEVSDGQVPVTVIETILDAGKAMLSHPVELLDGVEEAVGALEDRYTLMVITKGDLFHQESKLARSGLAERFAHVEIVSEKDESTYRRIIERRWASLRSASSWPATRCGPTCSRRGARSPRRPRAVPRDLGPRGRGARRGRPLRVLDDQLAVRAT